MARFKQSGEDHLRSNSGTTENRCDENRSGNWNTNYKEAIYFDLLVFKSMTKKAMYYPNGWKCKYESLKATVI